MRFFRWGAYGCAAGLGLLAAGGCVVDTGLPTGVEITCGDDDDCPGGQTCSSTTKTCLDPDVNVDPTLVIGASVPVNGVRSLADAPLTFTVFDANAGDTVAVELEYTIAVDADDAGAVWHTATAHGTSDPITDLASSVGESTFVWDALADAEAGGRDLEVCPADTDGDDATDRDRVCGVAAVHFRGRATDSDGGSSGWERGEEPFALGDTAPVTTLDGLPDFDSGEITLGFFVADEESDPCTAEVQFRVDGEGDWTDAAITRGVAQNLSTAPASIDAPLGRQQLLVWDSYDEAGGIGNRAAQGVEIQIRCREQFGPEGAIYGRWSAAGTIAAVRNQTVPRIEQIVARRAEIAVGAGPVAITYTLIDEESDPIDLDFEYSTDGAQSWSRCREYARPESEGRYGLASAPAGFQSSGGVRHTFVWDASGALVAPESTRIGVTLTDGETPTVRVEVQAVTPVGPPEAAGGVPFAQTEITPCLDPVATATADFSGDGIPEVAVICTSFAGEILQVHVGQATAGVWDGTFAPGPFEISFGDAFTDIAAVDLLGDGTRDLVVADGLGAAGDLFLLAGDGAGGFAAPVAVTLDAAGAAGVERLVALDADGDGIQDLLTANAATADVALLIGEDGGGAWQVASLHRFVGCPNPRQILLADFDGDGRGDLTLLCAEEFGGEGQITFGLTAAATGVDDLFADPIVMDIPIGLSSLASADFDWDGVADLVIGASGAVSVRRGRGDGTFDAALEVTGFQRIVALAAEDLNGDQHVDLLVGNAELDGSNTGDEGLYLVESRAIEQWAASEVVATQIRYVDTGRLEVGDFDADGLVDAILPTGITRPLAVLRGREPTPTDANLFAAYELAASLAVGSPHLADLDADGISDLLGRQAGGMLVARGTGEPPFGDIDFVPVAVTPLPGFLNSSLAADLDGDGIVDLATGYSVDDDLKVFFGEGQDGIGTLAFAAPVTVPAGFNVGLVDAGDVDNDGDIDLISVDCDCGDLGSQEGDVYLFRNQGDRTFAAPVTYVAAPLADSPRNAVLAELDGDGILDLVVANSPYGGPYAVSILAGIGDGSFIWQQDVTWTGIVDPSSLIVEDVNGDGRFDILVQQPGDFAQPGSVWLIAGAPGGGFTAPAAPIYEAFAWAALDIATVDLTGDGALDLVVATTNLFAPGDVSILVGQPSGGLDSGLFAPPLSFGAGGFGALFLRDLNRDQIPDVLATSMSDVWVLLGQETRYRDAWLRPLRPWRDTVASGAAWLGDDLLPAGDDLLGEPYLEAFLSQHRSRVGVKGRPSLLTALRDSPLSLPTELLPLTQSWTVTGDRRLMRVAEPEVAGIPSTGHRLRVEARFGPLDPASPGGELRRGMRLTGPFVDQRGVVIELPIVAARAELDLSGADVRLYCAFTDWARADAVTADPFHTHPDAGRYLPRVPIDPDADPILYRDVLIEQVSFVEIDPAPGNDLVAGEGARFAVVGDDPETRRVRTLADRLGTCQAFLAAP